MDQICRHVIGQSIKCRNRVEFDVCLILYVHFDTHKIYGSSIRSFFSSGDVESCSIDVVLWLNAIRKLVVLLVPAYSSHNSQHEMQPFLFIVLVFQLLYQSNVTYYI